jgi:hypothetical protein
LLFLRPCHLKIEGQRLSSHEACRFGIGEADKLRARQTRADVMAKLDPIRTERSELRMYAVKTLLPTDMGAQTHSSCRIVSVETAHHRCHMHRQRCHIFKQVEPDACWCDMSGLASSQILLCMAAGGTADGYSARHQDTFRMATVMKSVRDSLAAEREVLDATNVTVHTVMLSPVQAAFCMMLESGDLSDTLPLLDALCKPDAA